MSTPRSDAFSRFSPAFLISLLLLGTLFFIWPIPHTIGARSILLAGNLGLLLYLTRGRGLASVAVALRRPLWLYLGFSAWLLIVAVFLSRETAWSLGEILGQWGTASVALLIGALAALQTQRQGALKTLVVSIIMLLVPSILYVDYSGLAGLLQDGVLAKRGPGLTGGPDTSSFLTNIFLACLFAELLLRAGGKRFLPLGRTSLGILLALALFSLYVESVRNGMISLALLMVLAAVVYARTRFARIRPLMLAAYSVLATSLIGGFVFVYVKSDPRWQTFTDTVPIALDTKTYTAWRDNLRSPLPTLPSGEPVELSSYLRIAFMKEGLLVVRDHPLGVGYGRNAFGHAIQAKYGEAQLGHAHSGYIDLAVGGGIPGVLLWVAMMAMLFAFSMQQYRRHHSFAGLALAFIVFEFNARMLLDSINRDHPLQQFLFLVGLLAAASVVGEKPAQHVTARLR
jgi:O-antigen ligase